MPQIEFLTPWTLTLLALIPLLWALALVAPRRLSRWRIISSLGLRTTIAAALIFALAGAQFVLPARTLTTIFLLDRSESMSPAQQAEAEQFITESLASQRPGDQSGVIVFGQNALVERAPAQLAALGRLTSAPLGARTNLQEAIQLGLALFPDDTQKRLVLLSDGGNNSGQLNEALRLARARGIPVDAVSIQGDTGPDVLIERVNTPETAREGQDIAVSIDIRSSVALRGQVQVLVDGELALSEERDIPAGESSLALRVPAGESGFRQIEARIVADQDAATQNNRAVALTEVQGPPRLLIIAGEPQQAVNLRDAITASGARPEIVAPNQAPADAAQLNSYAGIILFNTPARSLPRALLEILPTYVRELGGSVAMIGGDQSFGAGGYRRTPIEPILPVELDPRDLREQPDVALAMVIDRSGSMTDADESGRSKLDLAKESVYQASLGLGEQDQIGLVVFDEDAEWVLPIQKLPDASVIEQALSQFGPGGGTNIRSGVEQAAEAMEATTARIKHVILLTDGIAESNYSDLITQMNQAGITISTVAIGEGANPNLETIAEQGGGRFYRVRQIDDVPNIFLQETVIIAGRDIIEQEVTPEIALQSPILRNFPQLPSLRGYNGTEQKETARTLLVTPDGKPLLAQEQIGLGRTVAWASDLDGRWSANWVQWSEFPRFIGGLIDLLIPPSSEGGLRLEASTIGDQAILDLTAEDATGQPLNNIVVEGRLVDPDQQGAGLSFTQVGPGRYRAVAPADHVGVYLAQLAAADASGQPIGSASAGVAVSYSPEYSDLRANPALLANIAASTNGRLNPLASDVYMPLVQRVGGVRELGLPLLLLALLLLPLDIAVRRLFVRVPWPRFQRISQPLQPAPIPADPALARLSAAKRRAQPSTASANNMPPTPVAVVPAPAATKPTQPAAKTQASGAMSDDQFARLLAAKKRARGDDSRTKN